MYTTVAEAKAEASLTKNNFITDEEVEAKIKKADSLINAYLIGKYAVPIGDIENEDKPVPELIQLISTWLAAGYLLKKDYGPMHPGDSKDGADKISDAMKELIKLQKGSVTLTDNDGNSLKSDSKKTTSSYPNDTSSSNQNVDYGGIGAMSNDVAATAPGNGPKIKLDKQW